MFNPCDDDRLVTGSTDGLINLYDVSQTDEDEALLQSFNTESSVVSPYVFLILLYTFLIK